MTNHSIRESELLARINLETGSSYRTLGEIDTTKRSIAKRVLPTLADALDGIQSATLRRATYSRFSTPYAKPWLVNIVKWWTREDDTASKSILNIVLARLVDKEHAELVWDLLSREKLTPNHCFLVARLFHFRPLRARIRDYILTNLNELDIGDLEDLIRVGDARMSAECRCRLDDLKRTRGDGLTFSIAETASESVLGDLSVRVVSLSKVESELAFCDSDRAVAHSHDFSGLAVSLVSLPTNIWFEIIPKALSRSNGRHVLIRKIASDRVEIGFL